MENYIEIKGLNQAMKNVNFKKNVLESNYNFENSKRAEWMENMKDFI